MGLVLVAGEPGIGKTRLASAAVESAGRRGVQGVWGRCDTGEGMPPYWPWRQVLRAVGRADAPFATGPPGPGSADRFWLFDAVAAELAGAARRSPLLVVLDDLHRADGDSLKLLRFLASVAEDAPLVLLALYRDTELPAGHPLAALIEEIATMRQVELVRLDGLTPGEIAALVPGGDPIELRRRTGGNPFFLTELMRPGFAPGAAVPVSVQVAVLAWVRPLPPATRELLDVAAVGGQHVDVAVTAAVARRTVDVVAAALHAAVASGLVVADGSGYRFVHDLVRRTLITAMDAQQLAAVHDAFAGVLERQAIGDPSRLDALAHHALAAARDASSRARALRWTRRAGEAAFHSAAYDTAVIWFERAETVAAPDTGVRAALLAERGRAAFRAGELRLARSAWEEAVALAADADPRGAAELVVELGRVVVPSGKPDVGLVRLLRAAKARLDPADPWVVALDARLAVELYWGDVPGARALAGQAVRAARAGGDRQVLAAALAGHQFVLGGPDRLLERVATGEELTALARELGDVDRELDAHRILFSDRLRLDPVAADAELEELDELDRRAGRPVARWYATLFRAIRATISGRSEVALELLTGAEALGDRMGLRVTPVFVAAQRFLVLRDLDRGEQHERALRHAAQLFPGIAGLRCQLAVLLAEAGRDAEAGALLDELAADACANISRDLVWLTCVAALAEVAAILNSERHCADLHTLLLPYRGLVAEAGPAGWCGAVDRVLGLAATTLGQWDAADTHFEDALRLHERWDAGPLAARTLVGHATMLRRRAAPGDLRRALGLDAAAARLHGRSPQGRMRGAPALTRREREVLDLLAGGATNREIAHDLTLSVHTIERHIANVYAKLGLKSRTEATAYVLRRGTPPL